MNNMVTIKGLNPSTLPTQVTDFLNPDYVYIPIKKDYEILVKTDKKIYKGEAILKNQTSNKFDEI